MTAANFKKLMHRRYQRYGRMFPWRRTRDPYRILVSEIMLQQTQTARVVPYYTDFLRQFPTFGALATASLRDVLRAWSGLGYNRRALYLKRTAEIVVKDFHGRLPSDPDVLRQLPGIGPYTAAAIACFAFGRPTVFIETNIRTVFIYHFFTPRRPSLLKRGSRRELPKNKSISDAQILPLIRSTLNTRNPRTWYYALMDYGAYLKKTLPTNPSRRSAHHARQTPFHGSLREVRGALVREIAVGRLDTSLLTQSFGRARIKKALEGLERDGIIKKIRGRFCIA